MKQILPLVAVILIAACNSSSSIISKHLNASNLPVQVIEINPKTDTTLVLQNGTKLHFPAGSLTTEDGKPARLEVKEAITIQQIMLAGLNTESDGKPLRSGGMIYINPAEGQDVEIVHAFTAEVPTQVADTTMQHYTGEVKDDGSINWKDPQPLETKESPALNIGEQLFKTNCASCHHPIHDGTGPALFGAEQRVGSMDKISDSDSSGGEHSVKRISGMDVIYEWVHNPAETMTYSPYFCNLFIQRGVMMQSFPALEKKDIDAIFYYINKEGTKLNGGKPYSYTKEFDYDSCEYYREVYSRLSVMFDSLWRKREKMIQFNQRRNDTSSLEYTPPVEKIPSYSIVSPPDYDADHYVVTINSFGWHNIDIPLGDDATDSELRLSITGNHANKNEVFLVIPASKVFVRGGALDDEKNYGFYEKSGAIPLLQGEEAYVFAIGENPDSAQLYFGSARFITSRSQNLTVNMQPVTKEDLENAIRSFRFNNISAEVARAINREAFNEVRKKILEMGDKINKCNCGVGESTTTAVTDYMTAQR